MGFIGAQHQDKADFLKYCVMEPVKLVIFVHLGILLLRG